MLLVRGVTYRIERTAPHQYLVVRLLDDTEVGTFRTRPSVRIESLSIATTLMREIVRAAMRAARTSAVMQAAPVFRPDAESVLPAEPQPSQPPQPESSLPPRSPSSAPPPASAHAH